MNRILNPATNPAGLSSLAAMIYAIVAGVLNVRAHHAAVSPDVIIAAIASFLGALTRQLVTPVSDPKDGNGRPLSTMAVIQLNPSLARPGYPPPGEPSTPTPAGPTQ